MNVQQFLDELQSLDVQNPGAWPLWARVSAAVLLALVILGAGGYFLVMPQVDSYNQAKAQEQQLRDEFVRKQQKVAALDAYKEQLAEMQKDFGAMLRQLPSKSEIPNLLNDISQTRIAAGLEEELFQPQPDVPKEFYAEIPNQIIVLGTYHEMGTFVSGIAALPRIVTVDNVDIRPAGGKSASGDLRMQAQVTTYRYLDEEEIAARAPHKGGGK